MDIIAGLAMGCIIGVIWGSQYHHWWNGTLSGQDAQKQISDDIKQLGEEIKTTGLEDRRTLEALMKCLNFYELNYIKSCIKESLIKTLKK